MKRRRIELSMTGVVASVLATVTGTICASYLGVAGTIIGAAVMSGVSTIGSAVYRYYIGRTGERLKTVGPVVATKVRTQGGRHLAYVYGAKDAAENDHGERDPGRGDAPAPGGHADRDHDLLTTAFPAVDADAAGQNAQAESPGPAPGAGGAEDEHGGAEDEHGGAEDEHGGAEDEHGGAEGLTGVMSWLRPRWLKLAGAAAGIFVVVIGVITVAEAMAGEPVSSAVWGRNGTGTTIGDAVTGSNGARPSPSPPASPTSPAPVISEPSEHTTPPATTPAPGATTPTSNASPAPSPSPTAGTSRPAPPAQEPHVTSSPAP